MMDPEFVHEQQIRSQIEELREKFPQTQDLYREVCVLLFFRYGVTPTANKLYQLVRKGSMSAPSEALTRFWLDLREKSRVRIEHPDLPEDLKQTAGELVAGLWTRAQALGHESLAAFREEASSKVHEAEAAQSLAEQLNEELSEELHSVRQAHAEDTQQIRSLEQQLAAAAATLARNEEQLTRERETQAQLQRTIDKIRSEMEISRRDFQVATLELESTREELETTRLRLTAEVSHLKETIQSEEAQHQQDKTALSLELGRAQAKSEKLENDLELLRAALDSAAEEHRVNTSGLQNQNGDLRQQIGGLEGRLQGAVAQREELSEEAKNLRSQHNALTGEIAAVRVEAEMWKTQVQHLEQKLSELSRPAERHLAEDRTKERSLLTQADPHRTEI